jgi:hypothetical protein
MFMDNRWITAHSQVLLRGHSTIQASLNYASPAGKVISATVANVCAVVLIRTSKTSNRGYV